MTTTRLWAALLAGALAAVPNGLRAQPPARGDAMPIPRADDDMQRVLDAHAGLRPKPIETLTPDEARRQPTIADAVKRVLIDQGRDTMPTALVPGVTSADRTIPGAAGPLPATGYTPAGAGPFPVIVYFHGGGWVIANKNVYDGGARGLAKAANAIVVSVDYRLAPEAKFPTQHAPSLNGDPQRLALAGESAGGTLRGLPPVTIVNAEIDPLLDDGAMLERALRSAGVSVERRVYDGVTHEFFGTAAVVRKAMDAQQYAGQRLQQALGSR